MGKKVIAIVFSDLHINDWAKFNTNNKRTLNHFKILKLIKKACIENSCPALFCGDLFHKPENISQSLLSQAFGAFDKLDDYRFRVFGISGNHDLVSTVKPGQDKRPISWLSIFSKKYEFLNCIDFDNYDFYAHSDISKNISVFGVPYIDHNIGLNEYIKALSFKEGFKNILLLHTDYPGAKDTDDSEVGTSENLNINLLDRFDLVLIGHIHKPQRLSKKVYMVGAPLQQRRTDKNCDLGYYKIYEDLTMGFVSLSKKFPKFIDVDSEEDVKDDGNYYTVISSKTEVEVGTTRITKKLSEKRLVRRYLKEKGIKDEKKENLLLDIIKNSKNE